ncbi:transcriptional regulator [Serratia sp. DD3]|uniref:transcriptional regulator n=1 Tax=Serratia sp. DD3 TaxID=1410619 RepID=UPI0004D414AC|nr:transcriptional regulator [Serratia sp. DD3]KEY59844.1 hypothetical protein SRDD_11830 [Serratia sp. DD3]
MMSKSLRLTLIAVIAMFGSYKLAIGADLYPTQYAEIIISHQRAVSALHANDLNAAKSFITGRDYIYRTREIRGEESWGELRYRAAKIIATAYEKGEDIPKDVLWLAFVSLFKAKEGLPDHPEIMLEYMHKAVAMLIADPQLLDNIDSKYVSTSFTEDELQKYAIWQYLSDGGEIDWKQKEKQKENYNDDYTIAGVNYRIWNIRFRKTLWNRGDVYLKGKEYVYNTVHQSLQPQIACVAQHKGWKLTLPDGYNFQDNYLDTGFNMSTCSLNE